MRFTTAHYSEIFNPRKTAKPQQSRWLAARLLLRTVIVGSTKSTVGRPFTQQRYPKAVHHFDIVFFSLILQLVLGCNAYSQAPTESLHRMNYASESFSIAVPATWNEMDPVVLAKITEMTRQIAPKAPVVKVNHGFTSSGRGPVYPWVAVMVTSHQINDEMFRNMSTAYRTVEEFCKTLTDQASGGAIETAHVNQLFYDKQRHVLWGVSQSKAAGVDLETLSGAYVAKTGTIQVHCYSQTPEFSKNEPVCRRIIESVELDPKIALPALAEH